MWQMDLSLVNTSETSLSDPNLIAKTLISVLPSSKKIPELSHVSQFEIQEMHPIEVFYSLKQKFVVKRSRKKRKIIETQGLSITSASTISLEVVLKGSSTPEEEFE